METTVINAQTAAVTTTLDARAYESVVWQVSGLGAAETVALNRGGGPTWEIVHSFDAAGQTNNTVSFTGSGGTPASVNMLETTTGLYQVVKGVTDGPVTVIATLGPHKRT